MSAIPPMRLPSLDEIGLRTPVQMLIDRVRNETSGIIAVTGQPATGKTTTLFSFALEVSNMGYPVSVVAGPEDKEFVLQLPKEWNIHYAADNTESSWRKSLQNAVKDHESIIVIMAWQIAKAVIEVVNQGRWVLMQVDTPFVGVDVTYNLRALGLTNQEILRNFSGIISQILLPRLCQECAQIVTADVEKTRLVYPETETPQQLWCEVGCEKCDHRGVRGRLPVWEILVIDDETRPMVEEYLEKHLLPKFPRSKYTPIQHFARELVKQGNIGINTYQQEVFQNPLLRVQHLWEQEQQRSTHIKRMFGRYISPEVMNSLIEDPTNLELGGERKAVTIMMTDLRGFTAISERLKPEQVVLMLNNYFEIMVDIVMKYNGTINEIIGDALLVIFGAPQEMPDRAQRAIACSIEMQNAMYKVNKKNLSLDLPELEMGIGLNEADVIVGNIGSSKRSKYAAVGSGVNMAGRIESYTVGGQIFISETVRREAGEVLRIDGRRDVFPKGAEAPLRIYEVGGISGVYNLALETKNAGPMVLERQIPLRCTVLEEKDAGRNDFEGYMIGLSKNCAEIVVNGHVQLLKNVKMNLGNVDEKLSSKDFYGKVIQISGLNAHAYIVRFTYIHPEIDSYLQALRQHLIVS